MIVFFVLGKSHRIYKGEFKREMPGGKSRVNCNGALCLVSWIKESLPDAIQTARNESHLRQKRALRKLEVESEYFEYLERIVVI